MGKLNTVLQCASAATPSSACQSVSVANGYEEIEKAGQRHQCCSHACDMSCVQLHRCCAPKYSSIYSALYS